MEEEPLYVYLSVTKQALSLVMNHEEGQEQKPIYFVCKVLQRGRSSLLEDWKGSIWFGSYNKEVSTLFSKPSYYCKTLPSHQASLEKSKLSKKNDCLVNQVMEFSIEYRPLGPIKTKVLVDFVVEIPPIMTNDEREDMWTLYVDGASNCKGNRTKVILKGW